MGALKISESDLGVLGFSMKVEATRVESDIMQVSKELWLEIAQRLIDAEIHSGSSPKEITIALHDLKFIQKGYENLAENDKDIEVRAVGENVDCLVECKTEANLYRRYAESLGVAIEALEKQTGSSPKEK